MTTSSHLFDANWYLTSPRTPSFLSRISPNLGFYAPMIWIVFKAGCNAMRNQYDGEAWAQSSEGIAHALESVGCRIEAAGMEHFRSLEGPCVFIGNHMSTLETFVLPSMIQPWKDVTFVVKESLLKYPFLGPVLGSLERIVVGRSNPREDLVAVLEGGEARLKQGRSVIVFPQSTRSSVFDPAHFNTIGVKLAKRAGVPVIPVALKTDAWGNGNLLKDFVPVSKSPSTLNSARPCASKARARPSISRSPSSSSIASAYGDVRLGNDGYETGEGEPFRERPPSPSKPHPSHFKEFRVYRIPFRQCPERPLRGVLFFRNKRGRLFFRKAFPFLIRLSW